MGDTDIRLALGHQRFRPVYAAASSIRRLQRTSGRTAKLQDLDLTSGHDNLGQAIIMRLLTPRGELAALGHPEYGSRLHEVIGAVNTESTRILIKLFILEALERESRVAEIRNLQVTPHREIRWAVEVAMEVRPTGEQENLVIGPLTLRLEP